MMKKQTVAKTISVITTSGLQFRAIKKHLLPTALLLGCSAMSGMAMAGNVAFEPDFEPNDSAATASALPVGTTVVNGRLDSRLTPGDADFTFSSTLLTNQVNHQDITNLVAGTPFYVAIDNTVSGVDTNLRTLDEVGTVLGTDDDSSPFGIGLADALSGSVNADGSIHTDVTGCCDAFAGSHNQSGDYDLLVFLGINLADLSDVDYFSFAGLNPGDELTANISSADFDITLGLFDDFGSLLASDDDSGGGLLSRLDVIVPASGILTFAVSGFSDFSFVPGSHNQFGDYQLVLAPTSAVPVPAAVWLFGSGLFALTGLARRKARV